MRTILIIIILSLFPLIITGQELIVDNRVGIATTVASAPLHIKGNNETLRIEGIQPWLSFYNGATRNGYLQHDGINMWLVNDQNGSLIFRTNNITRMTINPAGKVGIGTTDPHHPLDVYTSEINHAIKGECPIAFGVIGKSGSSVGVYGESQSNYGVEGYSPTNIGVYGWGGSNDFWAHHGTYGNSSSIRWKHNIVNISDPLSKLSKLRGVTFDWDAEHGGKHTVGFIAEEVGEVYPEVVFYEENGVDAKGMDYSKMTPLLVEAANAMRREYLAKFDDQRSEIAHLKQEMSELRKLLEAQVKNASED